MTTSKPRRIVLPEEIEQNESGGQRSLFFTEKRMTRAEVKAAIKRWRRRKQSQGYTKREIEKLEVEFIKTMQVRDSIPKPGAKAKRTYDDDY